MRRNPRRRWLRQLFGEQLSEHVRVHFGVHAKRRISLHSGPLHARMVRGAESAVATRGQACKKRLSAIHLR